MSRAFLPVFFYDLYSFRLDIYVSNPFWVNFCEKYKDTVLFFYMWVYNYSSTIYWQNCLLIYMSSLYISDINLLWDRWLSNIFFSLSVSHLFILLIVYFSQKLFGLMQLHLFILLLSFVSHPKYCCQGQYQDFSLFSQRRFMASGLKFKSLIHFELIFVSGVSRDPISLICL